LFSKPNIAFVVRKNIDTFYSYNTKKPLRGELYFSFLMPALISAVIVYLNRELTDTALQVIATAVSIFAALLFSLLILLYQTKPTSNGELSSRQIKIAWTVLRTELPVNIGFTIIVALLTILFIVVTTLFEPVGYTACVLAGFIYYTFILFVISLMIVLKRSFRLFGIHD